MGCFDGTSHKFASPWQELVRMAIRLAGYPLNTRHKTPGLRMPEVGEMHKRVTDQRCQYRFLIARWQPNGTANHSARIVRLHGDRNATQSIGIPQSQMRITGIGVNEDWSRLW